MENQSNPQGSDQAVDKAVGDIAKDFKIVGSHRVHSWYTWAAVGIIVGVVVGVVYVANRSGQIEEGDAAVTQCSFAAPVITPSVVTQESVYMPSPDALIYDKSLKTPPQYTEGEKDRARAAYLAERIQTASTKAVEKCAAEVKAREDAAVRICESRIKKSCEVRPSCQYSPDTAPAGSCRAVMPCTKDTMISATAGGSTYVCKAEGEALARNCSCTEKTAQTNVPVEGKTTKPASLQSQNQGKKVQQ